jgi:hypothetical protein
MGNTERCNTFSRGSLSLQLCQSSSVSEQAAQLSGSVVNTGAAPVCDLSLVIDDFDLATSYYPTWLPSYVGTFQPGDVATFGVTLPPASKGAAVTVAQTVKLCAVYTARPTAMPTGPPNATAVVGDGTIMTTSKGVDWGALGGMDTRCLSTCMNLIDKMDTCDAYNLITTFRCDKCDATTFSAVQKVCVEAGCGYAKCRINAPKSSTASGGRSLKADLSLLLGVLSAWLVWQAV